MTNPTGSILLRRGPTSDRLGFTPIEGEIIYDTLLKKIYVGDGQTPGGRTVSSDIVIGGSGQILNIPNSSLENNTISGVELGQNLRTLTIGSGLTGTSYNGANAVTIAIDASTTANGKLVLRDPFGNFTAGTITANLIGNASTVTNGVYTTGTYANPSWITSLAESKVLPARTLSDAGKVLTTDGTTISWTYIIPVQPAPNQLKSYGRWLNTNGTSLQWTDPFPTQSGNSGKFLSTNGDIVGWAAASAVGFPSVVGNDGKVLTVTNGTVGWGSNSADSILPNQTGNDGKFLQTNGGVVSWAAVNIANVLYSTNSYANPTWITDLAITQGGTGARTQIGALTNLLPVGEVNGYVLKTSGRGTYFWSAESGGGGTQGNTISTTRTTFTTTTNQTIFTGVGEYVVGAGQLRIYIDGVRQFPSEYTETSTTSFTLTTGLPAGVKVFAEVDSFVSQSFTASLITNAPAGNISSTNVQNAINELDQEKAPINSPTFTGTVSGITPLMVNLGNVTNESKATMFSSPTFTGTVSGVTATHVGLGNVTNESKATMFSSPTFTGTVSGVTKAMVGLGNVTNESKATMFTDPALTGITTIGGNTAVTNNGVLQLGSYAAVKGLIETATVTSAAPTATTNFDAATQAVQFYTTNTTTAFTLNVRGSSSLLLNSMLQVGQSISLGLLVSCSNAAHYLNSVTIDGTSTGVVTRWQGGVTPISGNASSVDVYTLTIIKTGSAPSYSVLASQTRFA
jgi:hypothetical protein